MQGSVPVVSSISPVLGSADGGDSVTITGSGFGSPTTVTAINFGTFAAPNFIVTGDTEILVTSPAPLASGIVDVTVTTTNGTSAVSLADEFTYLPRPEVLGVTPSNGSISGGTQVSILGNNFGGTVTVNAVNFGVATATQFQVTSNNMIVAVSPEVFAAETVDVTVTATNGTSTTSSLDQFTYQ